jgi:hypothetical protein
MKSNKENEKELFDELRFRLKKHYPAGTYDSNGYFDYMAWANSKASGIPLALEIKNKNEITF